MPRGREVNMKITAQEEYGVRCLLRLARAAPGRAVPAREVAATEGLSLPYATKLLSVLRRAGIVEGKPGWGAGFRLAKAPADIGLGSLLLILGEPLFDDPDYCRRHAGTETDGACVHQGACSLRALWHGLEQWLRSTLDRITLADLLQEEGRIPILLRARLSDALEETPTLIRLSARGKVIDDR
jgi:Rrf2 family protein